jgi:hypothetical protein
MFPSYADVRNEKKKKKKVSLGSPTDTTKRQVAYSTPAKHFYFLPNNCVLLTRTI